MHQEEFISRCPGDTMIVDLIAVGYRYSRKTILYFVMSKNAGTTYAGFPYSMKYTDPHGNLCERLVERPDCISRFFDDSNVIDSHNHVRQSELALETKWHTKDAFFRLVTTLIGMTVTDAWKLAAIHRINDSSADAFYEHKRMGIKLFAGALGLHLISCASQLLNNEPMRVSVSVVSSNSLDSRISEMTNLSSSNYSSTSVDSIRTLTDANKNPHRLLKLPPKQTDNARNKGTMTRKCKFCWEKGIRHDVVYYCYDCGMQSSFCSPDNFNKDRDCFAFHVRQIKRDLPKRKRI